MESWIEVIVEWVNCLNILDAPIKQIGELHEKQFYAKLLESLSWVKNKNKTKEKDIVAMFIKDEYPDFNFNNEGNQETPQDIYVSSLFLLRVTQEPIYHQPMCTMLQHETQIKIKSFLEMVLPHGRNLTMEVLKKAILEIKDLDHKEDKNGDKDLFKTPKARSLKDFFSSPVARSAQTHRMMIERNRELRQLISELEIERFEKADLQEDLRIQQNKIHNLLKLLEEKTVEIKALKAERLKLVSPQSCKKTTNKSYNEDYYKREIDQLEDHLMQRQLEVEKLEEEKKSVLEKLSFTEKQCALLGKKYENMERSLESLMTAIEFKDRELTDVKIANEDLRTHLKELNGMQNGEQSFEMDTTISEYPLSTSLNTSETLSTIVEIQLKEAKSESALLKAQIDQLNEKLETISKEHEEAIRSNETLKNRIAELKDIQKKFNLAQEKIVFLEGIITNERDEKTSLENQLKQLRNVLTLKEELLMQSDCRVQDMNIKIGNLEIETQNLQKALSLENNKSSELKTTVAQMELSIQEKCKRIEELLQQINSYEIMLQNSRTNLKDVLTASFSNNLFGGDANYDMDNMTYDELVDHLKSKLCDVQNDFIRNNDEIKTLNAVVTEAKTNIKTLSSDLECANHKLKDFDLKYTEKCSSFNDVMTQKQYLTEMLKNAHRDIEDKDSLIKCLRDDLEHLKKNKALLEQKVVEKEKEHLEQLNEKSRESETTIAKLSEEYEYLKTALQEAEVSREKLVKALVSNEHQLSSVQASNEVLEKKILENNDTINVLQKSVNDLTNQLNWSSMKVEELEKKKNELEIKYETLSEQNSESIHILKSENTKLSCELRDTNEKHAVLQQQLSDMTEQIKTKNIKISALLLEVSSLKLETERLDYVQKESDTNAKGCVKLLETQLLEKQRLLEESYIDAKLKEETIYVLRGQMDKLSKQTVESELKMKEVITNLQEVRTSQDAVLAKQEKVLEEKSMRLEELKTELELAQQLFNKQLESEVSTRKNIENKLSEQENTIYSKEKEIQELQESLKNKISELDTYKKQHNTIDTKNKEISKAFRQLINVTKELRSIFAKEHLEDEKVLNTENDSENIDILSLIHTATDEMHVLQKEVSELQALLEKTLLDHKEIIDNCDNVKEKNTLLRERICDMEKTEKEHKDYIKSLIKKKESLREPFVKIISFIEDLNKTLSVIQEKWNEAVDKFTDISITDGSTSQQLKDLLTKKTRLEKILQEYNISQFKNIKPVLDVFWKNFFYTEEKLMKIHSELLNTDDVKEDLDVNYNLEDDRKNGDTEEIQSIELILKELNDKCNNITNIKEEFSLFINSVKLYKKDAKPEDVNCEDEKEKKLQSQIDQLLKEKKDLKSKLDMGRVRNAKLERHLEELRAEAKKMKEETRNTSVQSDDLESLRKEVSQLKEANSLLRDERDKLIAKSKEFIKQSEYEEKLKEVHKKYESKLEEMKQTMKVAYNEQVSKLNKEQEKVIQEKVEQLEQKMKQQCCKHTEEITKYKAHVNELNSQFWNVGEKLLTAQQERQEALLELRELKMKLKEEDQKLMKPPIQHKAIKIEKQETEMEGEVQDSLQAVKMVTEETTYERRHSVKSMQAIVNAFNAEDEEGEVFDNIYLADMKEGNCVSVPDLDRLSILKMRNSLCKPHLKSSYPAETQFHPSFLTEEEIKTGSVSDDMFNDSLSQSLLPEQKPKKRDRTQTSYKKPGPPTPSRNGGRLSLQGNELKSPNSRILKERNADRRATATPRRGKGGFFNLKRQDENVAGTPKSRRISNIFRKTRATQDR